MSWKTVVWITVIVLVMGFCADVQAVTDFRIAGFSGRIAFVQIEPPVGNSFSYGGSVNLGKINANAYLRVDVLYWKSDEELYSPYWVSYELSDLATKVNIKYEIPCNSCVPYVGVGLSIHKYIRRYYRYGYFPEYDETRLGFHVFAGTEYPIWNKIYLFAEGAVDRSDRDQFSFAGGMGYRIK